MNNDLMAFKNVFKTIDQLSEDEFTERFNCKYEEQSVSSCQFDDDRLSQESCDPFSCAVCNTGAFCRWRRKSDDWSDDELDFGGAWETSGCSPTVSSNSASTSNSPDYPARKRLRVLSPSLDSLSINFPVKQTVVEVPVPDGSPPEKRSKYEFDIENSEWKYTCHCINPRQQLGSKYCTVCGNYRPASPATHSFLVQGADQAASNGYIFCSDGMTQCESWKCESICGCDWCDVCDHLTWCEECECKYCQFCQKERRMFKSECHCLEWQMEAIATQLASTVLGPEVSKVVAPVLGSAAKLIFGSGDNFDAPSIIPDHSGNVTLVDIPRQVDSLGFLKDDRTADQSIVCESVLTRQCLSIPFRCKTLSRIQVINWTTGEPVGTQLGEFAVAPTVCAPPIVASGTILQYQFPTALSYYANCFLYWRGGLRFTIECLPTHFHQGQLFIAFSPAVSSGLTLSQLRNCSSVTLDLGVNNRTHFDIPYVNQTDYCHVQGNTDTATTSTQVGYVYVFVQNMLVNNGTVANSIDVNIYISALDDFEFAVPRLTNNVLINWNGVWQSESAEVMRDAVLSAPIKKPMQLMRSREANVAVCNNVETADTSNVIDREYLLQTGLTFTTANVLYDMLYTAQFPAAFWDAQLATYGFAQFHEFIRMGFRFTVRINPTQFHQGCMLMFWTPADFSLANVAYSTIMQFPHTMMNIAGETNMCLDVPFSLYTRFVRSTDNCMGTLHVMCWNVLRAPASASTSVSFSVWAQALGAHIAVKHASAVPAFRAAIMQGEFQSEDPRQIELSDTAKESGFAQLAFKPVQPRRRGHIQGNHNDVLNLLRRRDYTFEAGLADPSTAPGFVQFAVVPAFSGRWHTFIAAPYAYASGSNRHTFTTSVARTVNIQFIAKANFKDQVSGPKGQEIVVAGKSYADLYNGGTMWNPAEHPTYSVELPFYRATPLVSLFPTSCPYDEQWPSLTLGFQQGSSPADIVGQAGKIIGWHHVGDDFMLYYPVAFPQYQFDSAAPQCEDKPLQHIEVIGHEDILLSGDIETNPGPLAASLGSKLLPELHEEVASVTKKMEAFLDQATPVMHDLSTFTAECRTTLPEVASSFAQVPKMVDNMNALITEVRGAFQRFSPGDTAAKFAGFETICSLIVTVIEKITGFVNAIVAIARGGPFIATGLAWMITQVPNKYWDLLQKKLTDVARNVGFQAEEWKKVLNELLYAAPTLVVSIAGFFNKEVKDKDMVCLMALARARIIEEEGLTFMKGLATIFVTAVDFIFENFGLLMDWYKCNAADIRFMENEWAAGFAKGAFTAHNLRHPDQKKRFKRMVDIAKRIRTYGPTVPHFPPEHLRIANEVLKVANGNAKTADASADRVPPIGIYLCGGSGVGKSLLSSTMLPHILMMKCGLVQTVEQSQAEIYNIPNDPEHKYFDGYTGQKFAIYDDFGQSREGQDVLQSINLISTATAPVNMASLEDKGMTFVSDFLCVSSNQRTFTNCKAINTPEAVVRRFPYSFEVTIRPGYKRNDQLGTLNVEKYSTDMKKFTTLDEIVGFHDRVFVFKRLNLMDGTVGNADTFLAIIDNIKGQYVRDHENFSSIKDTLRSVFEGVHQGPDDDDVDDIPNFLQEAIQCVDVPCFSAVRQAALISSTIDEIMRIMGVGGELDYADAQIFLHFFKSYDIVPNGVATQQEVLHMVRVEKISGKLLAQYIVNYLVTIRHDSDARYWVGLIISVTAIGAVLGGLVYLIYRLTRSYITSGIQQGPAYEGVFQRVPKKASKVHVKAVDGFFQGECDKIDKIRRNIRRIQMYCDDDEEPQGMNCLCLTSKFVLIPAHFYDKVLEERRQGHFVRLEVAISTVEGHFKDFIPINVSSANTVRLVHKFDTILGRKTDLILAYLNGANLDRVRDITHFIPTAQEWEALYLEKEQQVILLAAECTTKPRDDLFTTLGGRVWRSPQVEMNFIIGGEAPTKKGDCGRPYVVRDDVCRKPLAGLHSMAWKSGNVGAAPLVYEEIQVAMSSLSEVVSVKKHVEEEFDLQAETKAVDRFLPAELETFDKAKMNGVSIRKVRINSTDFRRWKRHDAWSDAYLPTAKVVSVYQGYVRDPLKSGYSKFVTEKRVSVRLDVHETIVDYFVAKFVDVKPRLYTDFESINGTEVMLPLNMATSTGIISCYTPNGKRDLFDADQPDTTKPQKFVYSKRARDEIIPIYGVPFVLHLSRIEEDLRRGKVHTLPWVATLKDELRKVGKVELGKTRVFEIPPLEFTILFRKYFGSFIDYYKSDPEKFHHGIGVEKVAMWKKWYYNLLSKSGEGFDGDYVEYDGSLPDEVFDFYREISDRYYGVCDEGDIFARHSLLHMLQFAYIVVEDKVVYVNQGNLSGNPITDVFNSTANTYLFLLSYLFGRVGTGRTMSLRDFDRDVYMKFYGDDDIVGADRETLTYFNRQTVMSVVARLGLTMTSGDKSEKIVGFEPIGNLTFLKSNFVDYKGLVVLAPRPKEAIYREIEWIRKANKNDKRIQKDIVNAAVLDMAHHGKEDVYEFIQQLADVGLKTDFSWSKFLCDLKELQDEEFEG